MWSPSIVLCFTHRCMEIDVFFKFTPKLVNVHRKPRHRNSWFMCFFCIYHYLALHIMIYHYGIIELDDGKIYRKPLYLMVKTMVSCRFSLKPIHWWSILISPTSIWVRQRRGLKRRGFTKNWDFCRACPADFHGDFHDFLSKKLV